MGKFFKKALRILELDERKCRRVLEDFMEIFWSTLHEIIFVFFSGVLNRIELILV